MRIALLGFGLIGGSIARALAARPDAADWSRVGWSPSGRGPAQALVDGALTEAAATVPDAIEGADLVVLAGPALDALATLDALAGPWRSALGAAATITDVVSSKRSIVDRADTLGLAFVGGHPMAGRETTGYEASEATLFVDRPWVVVPGAHARPDDVERVEGLAIAVGATPVRMSAADHDVAVAGISHLPLVLSAALAEAVTGSSDWPETRALAASGWRDMTRLAHGDVAMGTGIAVTNAAALVARIRRVQDVLDRWLTELDGGVAPDIEAIRTRLQTTRDRLERPPDD
jgi:prephenate dehydrogenase